MTEDDLTEPGWVPDGYPMICLNCRDAGIPAYACTYPAGDREKHDRDTHQINTPSPEQ